MKSVGFHNQGVFIVRMKGFKFRNQGSTLLLEMWWYNSSDSGKVTVSKWWGDFSRIHPNSTYHHTNACIRCFVINNVNLPCFIFAVVLLTKRWKSLSLSRIVIWGCCFCFAGPRFASMLRCTCVLLFIYIHILWESLGFTDCLYVAMLHYINLYQHLWLYMSKIVNVCVCVCG